MATQIEAVPLSLFGASRANFLALGVNVIMRSWRPKHPLSIPVDWKDLWSCDWDIQPTDFTNRALAFVSAAEHNRAQMRNAHDGGHVDEWQLVFAVGDWQPQSTLSVLDGKAELVIKTPLRLVRPDAAELARFGRVESEVAHA